ncbi:hypothetical protein HDU93_003068, partial [Gonapodya sp. JEL0774]
MALVESADASLTSSICHKQSSESLASLPRAAVSVPADLLESLRSHPLFATIPAREEFIRDLGAKVHVRHVSPGDIVIQEGEKAAAMFFIVRGVVEVQSSDDEIVFAELGSGCFFGEIGIVFQVPRTASIVAQTRCLLAVVRADEFQQLLISYPDVAVTIKTEAESRYLSLKSKKEQRARGNAIRVDLLEQMSSEFSEKQSPDATIVEDTSIVQSPEEVPQVFVELTQLVESATSESLDDAESVSSVSTAGDNKSVSSFGNTYSEGSTGGIRRDQPALHVSSKGRVGGLIQMFSGKRRASVAVWSDDKLQQLADLAVQRTGLTEPRLLGHDGHSSLLHESEPSPILGSLTPELCAIVFQYLDTASVVRVRRLSKRIDDLLRDDQKSPLRTADFSAYPKKVDDQTLSNFMRNFGAISENLCLRGCFYITNKGLQSIAQAPRLLNLDLGG